MVGCGCLSLVYKNPFSLYGMIDTQQKFCRVIFRRLLLKSSMAIMCATMPLFVMWFGCAVSAFCWGFCRSKHLEHAVLLVFETFGWSFMNCSYVKLFETKETRIDLFALKISKVSVLLTVLTRLRVYYLFSLCRLISVLCRIMTSAHWK